MVAIGVPSMLGDTMGGGAEGAGSQSGGNTCASAVLVAVRLAGMPLDCTGPVAAASEGRGTAGSGVCCKGGVVSRVWPAVSLVKACSCVAGSGRGCGWGGGNLESATPTCGGGRSECTDLSA